MAAPAQSFTLANGLRVNLVHAPACERAAALLRVAAGSHDEPAAFPGLAHFLEHLLFLGGERFIGEQRLMPFVQACGGRLNASTQARHTDYFFELPAERLDDGLARLLDMLVHPSRDAAAQYREREVLDAEYRARAGDLDTLGDAALAWGLAPGHPLGAFHAGHRASLALERAAFRPALEQFHAQHYHAGRMTLSLLGPQAPAQLRGVAERHGAALPAGPRPPPAAPPPLLPLRQASLAWQLPAGPPRLWLGFALDDQAAELEPASDFLAWLLADQAPGSLQAWLAEQGLADGLRLRLPYRHAGQALLVLEIDQAGEAAARRAQAEAALFDWLAWVSAAAPWSAWCAAYARQAAQRWARLPALERLREWSRGGAAGLDEAGVAALRRLLGQLRPERLIRLRGSRGVAGEPVESAGFALRLLADPAPSLPPFSGAWRCVAPAAPPPVRQPAALYLRWRLAEVPGRAAFFALQRALRPVAGAARWRGVELEFREQGADWQLTLRGDAAAVPQVLAEAVACLSDPSPSACAQGRRLLLAERERLAGELPIRQLWQRLPLVLAGVDEADRDALTAPRLAAIWRGAQWDRLVCGLAEQDLAAVPGHACGAGLPPGPVLAGAQRRDLALGGDEAALLLFCPLPPGDAATEAAWRLLGRCLETPFYQRLRSERQLGYALFSGFRQVAGQGGLLFAVQSPHAPVQTLLGEVEAFLGDCRHLRAAPLDDARQALLAELAPPADFHAQAEHTWSTHLAGCPADWPAQLRAALATLTRDDLLTARQTLLHGGRWLLISA